jgi:phosphate transport system substrate-binding protein
MKRVASLVVAVLVLGTLLYAQNPLTVTGAGASFPYPIYSKWFDEFHAKNANVQFNYQSVGSGAGIKQVTEGTVDFGASDMPMTDELIKAFQDKRGTGILHFPAVLGAAVPTYNIPGVTATLNFTPEALVGIYLGKITKWNDAAIASANKGVTLPANDIVVVHRSDGSGTTFIWTDYLSKVSSEWKNKGGSINWPVGLGGKGSEGVTGLIKSTPNSIGYVELIYAVQNNVPFGAVKNAAGTFVKADLASVSAAAAAAAKDMPADFRVSITNAAGAKAYPISSFTWLLIPQKWQDAGKREAVKKFLYWMLADGQKDTEALSYAKLPKEVADKEKKAVDSIQ